MAISLGCPNVASAGVTSTANFGRAGQPTVLVVVKYYQRFVVSRHAAPQDIARDTTLRHASNDTCNALLQRARNDTGGFFNAKLRRPRISNVAADARFQARQTVLASPATTSGQGQIRPRCHDVDGVVGCRVSHGRLERSPK